jgi:hypothetical protein
MDGKAADERDRILVGADGCELPRQLHVEFSERASLPPRGRWPCPCRPLT